jgi:hypothetical protein
MCPHGAPRRSIQCAPSDGINKRAFVSRIEVFSALRGKLLNRAPSSRCALWLYLGKSFRDLMSAFIGGWAAPELRVSAPMFFLVMLRGGVSCCRTVPACIFDVPMSQSEV